MFDHAERGRHYSECVSYGTSTDTSCKGCAPAKVQPGSAVCGPCWRRVRLLVDEAPDMVAHLRSKADPMKSGWNFDREIVSSSRVELPAPVASDLVDASDDIMRTLRGWALDLQFPGHPYSPSGLEAGAESDEAYADARACADVILAAYAGAMSDPDRARMLSDAFRGEGRDPEARGWWTVGDALQKWRLDDQRRWAKSPCPICDLRMVRVIPSRAGRVRFVCERRGCDWSGDDRDMFLAEQFVTDYSFKTAHSEQVDPDRLAEFVARSRGILEPERIAEFVDERRGEREAVVA
ncbi:hypothetical protein [Microbacterium marinum]|nr:hypothetical protein [Microbacterium marinum]